MPFLHVLILRHQLERMGLQLLDCLSRNVCCHILGSSHEVYHFNSFPPGVPSGTAIPQWAFQDVTVCMILGCAGTVLRILFQTSDLFNVTIAQSVGGQLPFSFPPHVALIRSFR